MKLTLKLFLVVCLFSSVSFAEGDMGNGGRACEGDMGNGGYTCEGDMGNGGYTCNCQTDSSTFENTGGSLTLTNTNQEDAENSILAIVQDYLISLFGQY